MEDVSQECTLFFDRMLLVSDVFHCSSDVLVALPVSESPLQLQILTLCEVWWKKDLKEKEKFALTALLIALKKCFTMKKMVSVSVRLNIVFFFYQFINFRFYHQAAEIQRVWNLHDVLLSVDYAAEETKGMINLLEDGFICPSFFRNDDVGGAIVSPVCLFFLFWL